MAPIRAIKTARRLDWQGWWLGIWSSAISGGAGAIGGGTGALVLDPAKFNVLDGGGLHLLAMIGIAFGVSGGFSLAKFLQTHPIPDVIVNGNGNGDHPTLPKPPPTGTTP